MRNAGLEEAQAGIKMARRYINNLRYADDTTIMAESEEELKSLLKVKEESEKAGSKLNMQKPKITHSDINHSRILYDPPPRILEIKAKINKWDLIKIKSFCTAKENISKMNRQPSEWEKITANEATDKQLISKIYTQLLQLNSRKINDPIKK